MKKQQQHHVIDKEKYKHYLIDEVETIRKENDKLKRNLNLLQQKYEKIVEVQEAEDCDTCICGMVTECNCKHMGYLKHNLNRIDLEYLNNLWGE